MVWWERQQAQLRLDAGFGSNIADGRSVVAPGFDLAAYGAGAKVLGEVAAGLGGNRQMIEFLADLHRRRAFALFTTRDLIDDVVAASGTVDRADPRAVAVHRPLGAGSRRRSSGEPDPVP